MRDETFLLLKTLRPDEQHQLFGDFLTWMIGHFYVIFFLFKSWASLMFVQSSNGVLLDSKPAEAALGSVVWSFPYVCWSFILTLNVRWRCCFSSVSIMKAAVCGVKKWMINFYVKHLDMFKDVFSVQINFICYFFTGHNNMRSSVFL